MKIVIGPISHRVARSHRPQKVRFGRAGAIIVIVALSSMSAGVLSTPVRAESPTPVFKAKGAGFFQPIRSNGYLVWQQNSKARPERYRLYARADGGRRFQVNARGTQGANGGIDGTRLVYQQFKGRRSNLLFFDLDTRRRSQPGWRSVNTRHWEYWPSISDRWLLFGRLRNNGVRRIMLFDLETGQGRTLARAPRRLFVAPGQVNGNHAVWYTCTRAGRCNVHLHDIAAGRTVTVPNPGRSQRAPSVTSQGTVYFARMGLRCGGPTELMRYRLGDRPEIVTRLGRGGSVGNTYAYTGDDGARELYYERNSCRDPAGSQVWTMDEPGPHKMSIATEGSGTGTVTGEPSGIECPPECTRFYDPGTTVTLTAAPGPDSFFGGWTGACTGEEPTCTVTIEGATSATAIFAASGHSLTVVTEGEGAGSVTSSPAGIDCPDACESDFEDGEVVTLTATSADGSSFAGWSGACDGSSPTCSVTIHDAEQVTAIFDPSSFGGGGGGGGGTPSPDPGGGSGSSPDPDPPVVTHTVTVAVTGDGAGAVTGDGGINCPGTCQADFDDGEQITLTAAPADGSDFAGWSVACAGVEPECVITVNGDTDVGAAFAPTPVVTHTVTVAVTGDGAGAVTGPGGINCPGTCQADFDDGEQITLTAAPADGSDFAGWSEACAGVEPECVITVNGDTDVGAAFAPSPVVTHTVTVALDGDGTVTSAPAGIECPDVGCEADFEQGAVVTLTAAPAAGFDFSGWSGACAGVEPECVLTIDGDKAVGAAFALNEEGSIEETTDTGHRLPATPPWWLLVLAALLVAATGIKNLALRHREVGQNEQS